MHGMSEAAVLTSCYPTGYSKLYHICERYKQTQCEISAHSTAHVFLVGIEGLDVQNNPAFKSDQIISSKSSHFNHE